MVMAVQVGSVNPCLLCIIIWCFVVDYGCNKSAFFYLSLKTSMMTAGPGKK